MPISKLGLVVLVGAIVGCQPRAGTVAGDTATPSGPLPVTRLRAEPYSFAYSSGFEDSVRMIVRDSGGWRSAWERLHGPQGEVPALPSVDFSREMIVLAAMGTRATGGFSIFVDSAYQEGAAVAVVVRHVSPGQQCGVTAALTQPVDLARIPAREGPVSFRERRETSDCR